MRTSTDYKTKFEELGKRIPQVRASLEQVRQEEVALADILNDLIKERDQLILDSRGVVAAKEAGALLGLHESTVRQVLVRQMRRFGMGAYLKDSPKTR